MNRRLVRFKKIVSMALVASIISVISPVKVFAFNNVSNENGELVFAVISDVHIRNATEKNSEKFKKALNIINREAPDSDALIIAGDLTDNGYASEYDVFNNIYDSYGNKSSQMLAVMGNHDYWNGLSAKGAQNRFEDKIGVEIRSHEVIEGHSFIQVSTEGGATHGEFSKELAQWLEGELESASSANPNKPIFLTVHQHIKDTVYGSDDWGNEALYDVIKDYPQVVTFSGHSHYPLNDERSINQRDFTSVGTSSLSYTELESGKINGSVPPNASDFSQGLIVRVKDDEVNIERLDFHSDDTIKDNWSIKQPATKENFQYTDERSVNRSNPYFEENSNIIASNITEDSATITFDQGKHEDLVHSYRLEAVNKETGIVEKSLLAFSEFYFGSKIPERLSFDITGLKSNTDYELRVYAIESFGKVSTNYLSANVKTKSVEIDESVDKPVADVFDFDFLNKSLKDKSESQLNALVKGNIDLEYNSELKQEVAKLDGNSYMKVPFNSELRSKVTNEFTVETVFKMDEIKNQAILLNTESGGLGFESTSNGTVEIWAHIGGSYKKVGVKLEKDKYYHLLASYNGKSLDLYLNGEKVGSVKATGSVYHPNVNFIIGGDPNSSGGAGVLFDGDIALARLYSKGVNASEVKKIYKEFDSRKNLIEVDSILNKISVIEEKLATKPENLLPMEIRLYEELSNLSVDGKNIYSKMDVTKEEIYEYILSVDKVIDEIVCVKEKAGVLQNIINKGEKQISLIAGYENEKLVLQGEISIAKELLENRETTLSDIDNCINNLNSAIEKFDDIVVIIPKKVNNLRADEVYKDSVKITWNEPKEINGLIGYDIFIDGKLLTSVERGSTEYIITNLKSNTIYGIKIVSKYYNDKISKPSSVNIRTKKS